MKLRNGCPDPRYALSEFIPYIGTASQGSDRIIPSPDSGFGSVRRSTFNTRPAILDNSRLEHDSGQLVSPRHLQHFLAVGFSTKRLSGKVARVATPSAHVFLERCLVSNVIPYPITTPDADGNIPINQPTVGPSSRDLGRGRKAAGELQPVSTQNHT